MSRYWLVIFGLLSFIVGDIYAQSLEEQIAALQKQTLALQAELQKLQNQLVEKHGDQSATKTKANLQKKQNTQQVISYGYDNNLLSVHSLSNHPESVEFYPTVLMVDNHPVTFIAGMPVVTSPYLGSRPAFDGSDYIVNISSINRDLRLLQQRRKLFREFAELGYPMPNSPIIAFSGKVEPLGVIGSAYSGPTTYDFNLGTGELDTAAIINKNVEAYLGLSYDSSPPDVGGQRISNSSVNLNMGFVNIGNLDKSPWYFTAGQMFVPFGRYSTSMVSAPLTMILARTKSRPFILGYKEDTGPYAEAFGFKSDTTLGSSGVGGVNVGYVIDTDDITGEVGASYINAINDSAGMQYTGSLPGTTFAGFGAPYNGSENVKKIPALGAHGYVNVNGLSLTAEWVGTFERFRTQDLSFNGKGAIPQAAQIELGNTFRAWDKPASLAVGYQWSQETLALNMPHQRISGVFNISIWENTIESLEYRHDFNFKKGTFANGANAPDSTNENTVSLGGASDTVLAQIGVYF